MPPNAVTSICLATLQDHTTCTRIATSEIRTTLISSEAPMYLATPELAPTPCALLPLGAPTSDLPTSSRLSDLATSAHHVAIPSQDFATQMPNVADSMVPTSALFVPEISAASAKLTGGQLEGTFGATGSSFSDLLYNNSWPISNFGNSWNGSFALPPSLTNLESTSLNYAFPTVGAMSWPPHALSPVNNYGDPMLGLQFGFQPFSPPQYNFDPAQTPLPSLDSTTSMPVPQATVQPAVPFSPAQTPSSSDSIPTSRVLLPSDARSPMTNIAVQPVVPLPPMELGLVNHPLPTVAMTEESAMSTSLGRSKRKPVPSLREQRDNAIGKENVPPAAAVNDKSKGKRAAAEMCDGSTSSKTKYICIFHSCVRKLITQGQKT